MGNPAYIVAPGARELRVTDACRGGVTAYTRRTMWRVLAVSLVVVLVGCDTETTPPAGRCDGVRCTGTDVCNPKTGTCEPADGGSADAGDDAGVTDAGAVDAGGVDGGDDAGLPDGGGDGGADAGLDAGTPDAGDDAGVDAGCGSDNDCFGAAAHCEPSSSASTSGRRR